MTDAYLYGADAAGQPGTEGLNAFFLLVDEPQVYNLPPAPTAPNKKIRASWASMAGAAAALGVAAVASVLSGRLSR